MDNDHQHIPEEEALIDRFLQNEMTEVERAAFMTLMAGDETLKRRVDDARLLSVGIQEAALRDKIDEYQRQVTLTKPRLVFKRQWLAAAVIVGLMMLSAIWLVLRPGKQERLFSEFYRPDPGLMTSMGASENYTFEKAMIEYKTGNYTGAVAAWKELAQIHASDTLEYFIGSAYLALKRPAEAIPRLKSVADSKASVFNDDALWYLGLALLKSGRTQEAIAYIERSSRKEKEALIPKLR